jgi:hypothetical protein
MHDEYGLREDDAWLKHLQRFIIKAILPNVQSEAEKANLEEVYASAPVEELVRVAMYMIGTFIEEAHDGLQASTRDIPSGALDYERFDLSSIKRFGL